MKVDTGLKADLVNLLCSAPCESEYEGQPGSCPDRRHGVCREILRLDYCAVRNLADNLIANGVNLQRWIPVEERLPDHNNAVLVYCANVVTGGHTAHIGSLDSGKFWFLRTQPGISSFPTAGWKVTHWMHLPDAPGNGKAPRTIGNKIRDLVASDEGIAEIMLRLDLSMLEDGREFTHLYCDGKNGCVTEDDSIICTDEKRKICVMSWLKQPAESVKPIFANDEDKTHSGLIEED